MTHVRYRVVGYCVALAAVTYLDRVCISTLAPQIMRELHLSRVEMSYVFSAFTLAYALFEIPTAWWGEKVGTRRVLARIVGWWSTFTMLTAAAWNFWALVVTRFLFGAGEAGAWPNVAKTFSRWIPACERGRVQGIFFMGAHLAGGFTPALVALLTPHLGWRGVFLAFGGLGFLWVAGWLHGYRDDPAAHPAISPEEVKFIDEGRVREASHGGASLWRLLASNRNVILLCVTYFSNGYGFYFLITWLPTYLEQQRGFSKAGLSLFAGLPLLLSVFADLFGGIATDRLARRFGLRAGRAGVGAVAYLLAAGAILAAAFTSSALAAAALIALAAAASMFTLAASWAACIEVGGRHSGVVSAAMNTTGQAGGILSPIVLAYLVEWFADWRLPLIAMCILYFVSFVGWLFIDPNRRLAGED